MGAQGDRGQQSLLMDMPGLSDTPILISDEVKHLHGIDGISVHET